MKQTILLFTLSAFLFTACSKDEIDQEQPVINMTAAVGFPQNCDTLWAGDSFTFTALFTDNQELGSFSIEIHENFDHHAHSTETEACELMPEKEPVNPFQFLHDYSIPQGMTEYKAGITINIPDSINNAPIDAGDYHFFISLTDREGWSTQKGIALKILPEQPSI